MMQVPEVLVAAQRRLEQTVAAHTKEFEWADAALTRAADKLQVASKELFDLNKAISTLTELGYELGDV